MQNFELRLNEIMFVISKLIQQWQSSSSDRYKLFKSLCDIHLQMHKLKSIEDQSLSENEFLIKSEDILRRSELITISIFKSKNILEGLRQNLKKILVLRELVYKGFPLSSPKQASTKFLLFLHQTIEQLPQLILMLEKECSFHSSAFWDFATSDNYDLHNFLCLGLENQVYVESSILSHFYIK